MKQLHPQAASPVTSWRSLKTDSLIQFITHCILWQHKNTVHHQKNIALNPVVLIKIMQVGCIKSNGNNGYLTVHFLTLSFNTSRTGLSNCHIHILILPLLPQHDETTKPANAVLLIFTNHDSHECATISGNDQETKYGCYE